MQVAGATAFAPSFAAAAATPKWPIVEGPNTPKICLGGGGDEAALRRVKQLGVDYVVGGGLAQRAAGGQGQRGAGGSVDLFPGERQTSALVWTGARPSV